MSFYRHPREVKNRCVDNEVQNRMPLTDGGSIGGCCSSFYHSSCSSLLGEAALDGQQNFLFHAFPMKAFFKEWRMAVVKEILHLDSVH
jgi:hypothetical protein